MRLFVLLLAVQAGCGRAGFESLPDGPRGPGTDGQPCDAPQITLAPPPVQPFGAPTRVVELNAPGASDDDPTLTGDELEIYFESARSGTGRIWRSVRGARTDPWPAPSPVPGLDGANTPEISRDGLVLRFSMMGAANDLFVVSRPDRASVWGAPSPIAELNTTSNESAAAEFLGGNAVVFGSDRAGGNAMGELWEAQRDPVTCLLMARVLTGLESAAGKANPWMRDDGLAIVYPVEGSTGAADLHIATRPAIGAAFFAPVELVQLNFGGVDDDPWVNDALDTVYFMSTRTGGAEIYVATR